MKKLLLPFLLFLGLTLISGGLFGQAPVLNYAGSPYTVTNGTAITPISPNTTNTVGTYGAVNATWQASVRTGNQSGAIYYDAFTGFLYTSEYTYGELDKITGLTTTPAIASLNSGLAGTSGYSIVTDNTGVVYYCDNANSQVLVFPSNSGTASITLTGFTAPKGLAIDAANNLYVVDAGGGGNAQGKIYKIAKGATTIGTALQTGLANPFGIAISGSDIYLTQFGTTTALKGIFKITGGTTTAGAAVAFVGNTTATAPFNTPRNLTFDGNGNLFVADYTNAQIERITPAAAYTIPVTGLTNPNQVTFDASGNLYVGDLTRYYKKCIGTYYTYTGTLPTGLTLNPVTGVISGTPTAAGSNPVTVTATNATGASAGQALTFNFTYPPATVSYTSTTPAPPYTFTVGTALPNTIIPTSSNVRTTPTPAFSISPTLPGGLTFTATNGQITGTPTGVSASQPYTVTVYNNAGTATTTSFNLQVVLPPAPGTFTYSPAPPMVFTQGTLITSETPSANSQPLYTTQAAYIITNNVSGVNSGTGTANTTIPGITGLVFNPNTGVISGTATSTLATTSFTVTANNAGGSTPLTFNITVNPPVPTVSYTGSPYTFGQNVAISSLTPSTTNSPTIFSVSPALPAGLSINLTSGVISGTPSTAQAAANYTISAYNANPTPGTATISITVVAPPASVSYTPAPPMNFTNGTPITTETITYSGGTLPATGAYSIKNNVSGVTNSGTGTTGTVPGITGLVFSYNSGQISGTPSTTLTATSFTVFATNQAGNTSITFNITVYPAKPTIAYTGSPFTFGQNVAITPLSPTTTGSATSYAVSPGLPAGLSIDPASGIISGTPTAVQTAATYTISAYNVNPTPGTTTISITVVSKAALTYPTPNTYPVGTAIATLAPTNSGGAVPASAAISTTGTVVLTTGNGLNKPVGMAVDPTGNVYVVNAVGNNVTEYSTAGTVSTFGSSANLSTPVGLVFDSSGNAYVLNQTGTVVKYTGGVYQGTILTGLGGTPTAIAIDASNNIYIANSGTNTITKYTTAGGAATLTITAGAGYSVSGGLAVDASGNIYAVDNNGGAYVDKYTSAGALSTYYTVGNTANAALFIDPANNIYLTDTGGPEAIVATAAFGSTIVTETGFTTPRGIVADKKGNLFVSDFGAGTVTRYAPTAGFYLNGTLPTGLVFNSNNGNITGTPQIAYNGSYTVTPYNQAGVGTSNTFTITCTSKPVITYPTPDTYNAGTPITPLTPTNTGSAATGYSAPSLPAGLSISPTTGVISGTPTTGTATGVNYVVTATNSYGSGTFTINITIIQAPAISYTPSTNNFPVNAAITPLTPANAGGPVAPSSFGSPVPFNGGTLNKPYGLAFDATGNVYVANYALAANNVLKYTSTGTYTSIYIARASFPAKANPTGVGFDASGNAYVTESSGYLYKFASGGAYSSTITTTPNEMDAVWVDAGANVFIADNTDNAVYKYLPGGTTPSLTIPASTHLAGPISVATDAAGNIYVLDNTNNDVVKYSSTGTYISTPVTGLSNPYGLYIDGSGNIFVADPGNGTVNEYDSTGALLASLTGLTNPRGVIADASGNIYVSDYSNNTLIKYSPTFSYAISAALPTGLSFNKYTGVISGTPTVTPFGPTTYTVTAYGYGGTSSSTNVTISVYTSYDWIGATADWQTTTNWKSNTVPTSSSPVIIGVNYPFANAPVVSSTGSANAASVTFGNKGGTAGAAKLAGITVNAGYSLTVAGAIAKQSDVNSATAYISTLSGGGTITAASLSVLPNLTATAAYADGITSTLTGTSPAAGLAITGNVTLTSASSPQPATLSFNVTGGVTSVAGTLSTNNASGSTSTFKVSNGTLQLANSAALSALSSNGTNTLSFVNTGATIEYSGAAQTVYTDAAITGLASGVTYQNIKFSGTGVKTPNGTATSNLNIEGDFTNALANTTASNVVLTGTTVNFNGSGVQNLYGGPGPTLAPGALTTAAPSPTGTVFGNVTINNPLAAANNTKNMISGGFSIASNGVLTMVGGQSYTSLTTNGNLTLNSDATGSATVAAYSGPLIIGTVHVQRYITGGGATYRGYRLLSAPVTGLSPNANKTDLSYIKYTSYLKGYNGTAGGWDAAGNPNLFLYRENLAPSNATFSSGNYRSITTLYTTTTPNYSYLVDGDGTTPYTVPTGTGYLFYFRGDRHADSIAVEGVAGYASQPAILTATGVLNHGAVSVTNWYTGTSSLLFTNTTANSAVRGFNLVGNPYASTIDLMTASTTAGSGLEYPAPLVGGKGVETNFYELNPVSQNYDVWSNSLNSGAGGGTNQATRYIVSGQGFFVKADTINQRLTFNESAKVNNQNTGPQLFEAANPVNAMQNIRALKTEPIALSKKHNGGEHLRLQMALDSVNTDDIYIGFDPSAQTTYTFNQDALYKQGAGKVSLSSMSSDNVALAINVRPLAKPTNTINLNVSAVANGNYTLNMTELKEIPSLYEVWLMDAYLKDSLDMRQNKTYSFTVALTDTNSFGAKRFSLVIREKPGKGVRLLNFIANKVTNGAKVIWKTENELNYTNFTVQRSIDNGKTFDNLNAFVSNDEGSYSFLDTHPVMPADNYRLKITDLNGNISYSDIAPLQYSNLSNNIAKNAITIYPNPTVGPINMAVTQTFKAASFGIQIVNSNGTVVHTTTSATPTWQADMSKLLPGTYVIQVMNNADKTVVGKGTFVKL